VEVIAYKGTSETTEGVIEDISKGKKINRQFILQSELLENAVNWNFLTKDARYREFYEAYWEQTDDIVCYYDHKLARHTLGSTFYFDSGYSIDEQRAGSANSDRGLSGGSVLWQSKMAEKRRTDEQTSTQEPFGDVQGQGGFGGDPGREDFGRTGRAV
jgi:hypothetical protein